MFQYPLLAHKINQLVAENAAENEGVELSLQKQAAQAQIQDSGLSDFDRTKTSCPEYEGLTDDRASIDWDHAFREYEEGDAIKTNKQQQEQDRKMKQEQKAIQEEIANQKAEFERKAHAE